MDEMEGRYRGKPSDFFVVALADVTSLTHAAQASGPIIEGKLRALHNSRSDLYSLSNSYYRDNEKHKRRLIGPRERARLLYR